MSKNILSALTVAALYSGSAFAQDAAIETSLELGGTYSDSVTLKDNDSTLNLSDLKTLDLGLKAEREISRRDNFTLSGALSGQARFGEGQDPRMNGLKQADHADFRRLGVYADAIARIEGSDGSDWTPFLSIGAGLVQDRVALDDQVFTDLSPVGRFRAGAEKKINDKATFGIGVGPSFKLD